MNLVDKYNARSEEINSLLCVSLDADFEKIPEKFRSLEHPQFEFNKHIIASTNEFTASYKLNIAFYESRGAEGMIDLKLTMDYLLYNHSDIFTICDAKRGDVINTNIQYSNEIFDYLGFDSLTVQPYLGKEPLKPMLERKDKVTIVLCRTSNPGASEVQDLLVDSKPLWQVVAEKVSREWNDNNNCMLVMGATYPEEMKKAREATGDMTFLVPGIGTQGGDMKKMVVAGLNKDKKGLMVVVARAIIFADDPKSEAQKFRNEINKHR